MRSPINAACLLLALGLTGCDDRTRMAIGAENSIIVVVEDTLWAEVQDTVLAALEPRIFAVRDERTFSITQVSPYHRDWAELRRFRQILAVGSPSDGWVETAVRRGGARADTVPAVVEADNVWARNQRVTVVLVPEDRPAEAVRELVAEVHRLLDRRYRVWAQHRMYLSGVNAPLADTLMRDAAFSLRMPNVYRWRQVGDSAYMFLNDQPDPSQLVRLLLVTWRTAPAGEPSTTAALTWRDSVAGRFYDWGQTSERDRIQVTPVHAPGDGGIEIRGIWVGTLEDFPQAGPFITRVVDCPGQNRRYLLDTWLYAPARSKYQYMIQLETLLDSFGC